ncbi:acyl-CoA thioesterase [Planctomicrobium sp. SH527]|uniref:acyl-CoA thioesterase n=1 Tax=Planctomicrobium sp. SH527 TaxID=3448123 RepID=UPI003F5CB27A
MTEQPQPWCEASVRVRYAETDAMGYLHHSNYITYFEIARTELFRSTGGNYRSMEERGFFLVVVSVEVKYKRPAHYDDELSVCARLARWTGAKLIHDYEVRRGDELLATGQSVIACVNQKGEVQRMSLELLYPDGMTPLE